MSAAAPSRPRKQTTWPYFIVVMVLALIGYLATEHFIQQTQVRNIEEELQKNKETQAGQSQVQSELSTQRSAAQKQIADLTEQITRLQERLETLEKMLAVERPIQKQAIEAMRNDIETARHTGEDLGRAIQKLQDTTTREISALNKSVSRMEKLENEREKTLVEQREKAIIEKTTASSSSADRPANPAPPPSVPATPVTP